MELYLNISFFGNVSLTYHLIRYKMGDGYESLSLLRGGIV